jgi:hypothetical protein
MQNILAYRCKSISTAMLAAFALSLALPGQADPLSADTQAKVEAYKKKLTEWAADPVFVEAVKSANGAGGAIAGMTNAKWDGLAENDPAVMGLQTSPAGQLLTKLWTPEKAVLSKLFLRDNAGNLVACHSKPFLYNAGNRPHFKGVMGGKPWAEADAKADPTTGISSVQVAVPVLDGGKFIGELHTAVNVH